MGKSDKSSSNGSKVPSRSSARKREIHGNSTYTQNTVSTLFAHFLFMSTVRIALLALIKQYLRHISTTIKKTDL